MTITKEDVAEATRQWFAAYDDGNYKAAAAVEARSFGFGRSARAPRDIASVGETGYLQAVEGAMGGLEYYRTQIEELHTAVEGDVGMAWGLLIDEFQERGREPERRRGRFSHVLTRGAAGWQMLLFHRDSQPFDEEGRRF